MSAPRYKGLPKPSKYRSAHCWWCVTCDMPVDAPSAITAECLICGAGPAAANIIHFDSKRERARWGELRLLERAGHITDLRRQVDFPIKINGKKIGTYRCDFEYRENDQTKVIDVKGIDTPLSKFKRGCVEAQYGIEIDIVR